MQEEWVRSQIAQASSILKAYGNTPLLAKSAFVADLQRNLVSASQDTLVKLGTPLRDLTNVLLEWIPVENSHSALFHRIFANVLIHIFASTDSGQLYGIMDEMAAHLGKSASIESKKLACELMHGILVYKGERMGSTFTTVIKAAIRGWKTPQLSLSVGRVLEALFLHGGKVAIQDHATIWKNMKSFQAGKSPADRQQVSRIVIAMSTHHVPLSETAFKKLVLQISPLLSDRNDPTAILAFHAVAQLVCTAHELHKAKALQRETKEVSPQVKKVKKEVDKDWGLESCIAYLSQFTKPLFLSPTAKIHIVGECWSYFLLSCSAKALLGAVAPLLCTLFALVDRLEMEIWVEALCTRVLFDRLEEEGQRKVMEVLLKLLPDMQTHPILYRLLAGLLHRLGEAVGPLADQLHPEGFQDAFLKSEDRGLKALGSVVVKRIGEAIPSRLAELLHESVYMINVAYGSMAYCDKRDVLPLTLTLEGHGMMAAGLVASAADTFPGIPKAIVKFGLNVAMQLLDFEVAPTQVYEIECMRRRVGWALFGCVCRHGYSLVMKRSTAVMDGWLDILSRPLPTRPAHQHLMILAYTAALASISLYIQSCGEEGDEDWLLTLTSPLTNFHSRVLCAKGIQVSPTVMHRAKSAFYGVVSIMPSAALFPPSLSALALHGLLSFPFLLDVEDFDLPPDFAPLFARPKGIADMGLVVAENASICMAFPDIAIDAQIAGKRSILIHKQLLLRYTAYLSRIFYQGSDEGVKEVGDALWKGLEVAAGTKERMGVKQVVSLVWFILCDHGQGGNTLSPLGVKTLERICLSLLSGVDGYWAFLAGFSLGKVAKVLTGAARDTLWKYVLKQGGGEGYWAGIGSMIYYTGIPAQPSHLQRIVQSLCNGLTGQDEMGRMVCLFSLSMVIQAGGMEVKPLKAVLQRVRALQFSLSSGGDRVHMMIGTLCCAMVDRIAVEPSQGDSLLPTVDGMMEVYRDKGCHVAVTGQYIRYMHKKAVLVKGISESDVEFLLSQASLENRQLVVACMASIVDLDPAWVAHPLLVPLVTSVWRWWNEVRVEEGGAYEALVHVLVGAFTQLDPLRWFADLKRMYYAVGSSKDTQEGGLSSMTLQEEGDGGKAVEWVPRWWLREKILESVCTLLAGGDVHMVLVPQLDDLVTLAYTSISSQNPKLMAQGVALLAAIIERYGTLDDPHDSSVGMLNLYQAQLSGALRTALRVGGEAVPHPQVRILAYKVLPSYIRSKLDFDARTIGKIITQVLAGIGVPEDHEGDIPPAAKLANSKTFSARDLIAVVRAGVVCLAKMLLVGEEVPTVAALVLPTFTRLRSLMGDIWVKYVLNHAGLEISTAGGSGDRPHAESRALVRQLKGVSFFLVEEYMDARTSLRKHHQVVTLAAARLVGSSASFTLLMAILARGFSLDPGHLPFHVQVLHILVSNGSSYMDGEAVGDVMQMLSHVQIDNEVGKMKEDIAGIVWVLCGIESAVERDRLVHMAIEGVGRMGNEDAEGIRHYAEAVERILQVRPSLLLCVLDRIAAAWDSSHEQVREMMRGMIARYVKIAGKGLGEEERMQVVAYCEKMACVTGILCIGCMEDVSEDIQEVCGGCIQRQLTGLGVLEQKAVLATLLGLIESQKQLRMVWIAVGALVDLFVGIQDEEKGKEEVGIVGLHILYRGYKQVEGRAKDICTVLVVTCLSLLKEEGGGVLHEQSLKLLQSLAAEEADVVKAVVQQLSPQQKAVFAKSLQGPAKPIPTKRKGIQLSFQSS